MITFFAIKNGQSKEQKPGLPTVFHDEIVMIADNAYFSYNFETIRWERNSNLDQDPKHLYKRYDEISTRKVKDMITVFEAKFLLME